MDDSKPLIIIPPSATQDKTWVVYVDEEVYDETDKSRRWETVEREISAFDCQINSGVLVFRNQKGAMTLAIPEHLWTRCALK